MGAQGMQVARGWRAQGCRVHWGAEHIAVQGALGCREPGGAGAAVAAMFAAGWKHACADE